MPGGSWLNDGLWELESSANRCAFLPSLEGHVGLSGDQIGDLGPKNGLTGSMDADRERVKEEIASIKGTDSSFARVSTACCIKMAAFVGC